MSSTRRRIRSSDDGSPSRPSIARSPTIRRRASCSRNGSSPRRERRRGCRIPGSSWSTTWAATIAADSSLPSSTSRDGRSRGPGRGAGPSLGRRATSGHGGRGGVASRPLARDHPSRRQARQRHAPRRRRTEDPRLRDRAPAGVGVDRGGSTFGSPSYMAPERIDGKTPDARADVFSLGAVLYEMLTGRRLRREGPGDDRPEGLPRGARSALGAAGRIAESHRSHRDAGHREGSGQPISDGARFRRRDGRGRQRTARAASGRAPRARATSGRAPSDGTIRAGSISGLALPAGKRVSLAILEGLRQGQRWVIARPKW